MDRIHDPFADCSVYAAFATQDQNEQRERSGVMQDQNEQRERLIVTDRSFFIFFSILVRNFVMKRTLYV